MTIKELIERLQQAERSMLAESLTTGIDIDTEVAVLVSNGHETTPAEMEITSMNDGTLHFLGITVQAKV